MKATKTTTTTAAESFPTTTKQRVLLALTLPLAPLAVYIAAGVRATRQSNPAFHQASDMPQPQDLLLSIVLALVLVPLRSLTIDTFGNVARRALPPAFRANAFRVDRFATSLFKLAYFSAMAVAGFWIEKDEPWFPTSLGGSGDFRAAFSAPTRPPSSALRLYMLVELAYLAHNLVFVVLCKPVDDDTMDFVIHDLTGMLLIASAYLVNYNAVGAVITFLNDTSDVVHYLLLLATDSRRLRAVGPSLLLFLVGWGYTRLFVFPRDCLRPLILDASALDAYVSMLYLGPSNALLGLLLGLQIYWYQMLARKGFRVLCETSKGSQTH